MEAEVQKGIDQFCKKLQDDFIQDKMLHAYKQNKISSIDDLNKMKTILPSSFWKVANEKMKRSVEICCNFQHIQQGMKFDNYIERTSKAELLRQYHSVLQQRNKCLCLDGYHYYQITLTSLPVTHSIYSGSNAFELTIPFSAQNNVISFSFNTYMKNGVVGTNLINHPLQVDAGGHQLYLKCVEHLQEYICEQSINKLKDSGFIVKKKKDLCISSIQIVLIKDKIRSLKTLLNLQYF